MKTILLFFTFGFFMASCATFPVEGWKKPSSSLSDEQMQKDILECQNIATQAVGPPPNFGTIVWFADRNNAFEMCMKSRGYVR